MFYRIKKLDEEWSLPVPANNISLLEHAVQIDHTDGSLEWIPLINIESIKVGTDQPWTKVKVNVKETEYNG